MDALLRTVWLDGDEPTIPTLDEASVALVREQIRAQGGEVGLGRVAIETAAVVASELAHNQLAHARGGRVGVRSIRRGATPGLEIVAADRGTGIVDPVAAFTDAISSRGTLGVGLPGARRLAHEMDVDVRMGEGTCIWARVFASALPRAREVGILGRPFPGELLSGDQAIFLRDGEGALTLAIADGLGHGPAARVASDGVMQSVRSLSRAPLLDFLAACDRAIEGTRGAVVALLAIAEDRVEHGAIGNITSRIERRDGGQSFTGTAGVAGSRRPLVRPSAVERAELRPRDVVIAFTDGLASRASIAEAPALAHEAPIAIAQWLLERFGRGNDDALIVVVK